MGYFLAVCIGYLLGCSNLAYYISRAAKKDIRKDGSGNLGASNATVLFGWKAGVSVAVHDIGKAFLAALMAKWLFPELEYAGAAAGVAANGLLRARAKGGSRVVRDGIRTRYPSGSHDCAMK